MVSGGFRLDLLLETARLARSTYYYQLKQLDGVDKDQELKTEIQAIYNDHKGNYGYRRIHLELRKQGISFKRLSDKYGMNLSNLKYLIRLIATE